MLEDFVFEKDLCSVCLESKLPLILFNAIASPKDWVSIVDGDMGDPRLRRIENFLGMKSEKALEEGYAPSGFVGGVMFNYVRCAEHFYEWLKSLKGYK